MAHNGQCGYVGTGGEMWKYHQSEECIKLKDPTTECAPLVVVELRVRAHDAPNADHDRDRRPLISSFPDMLQSNNLCLIRVPHPVDSPRTRCNPIRNPISGFPPWNIRNTRDWRYPKMYRSCASWLVRRNSYRNAWFGGCFRNWVRVGLLFPRNA